ncbi:flavodoxin [Candidatus Dojkabacteria bacterium]|nr:flavodoxin [Candidatus Dojkabacteria bacterium]
MEKKVLIIYGSTTGNTQMCSQYVKEGLEEAGISNITVKNVLDAQIKDLDEYEYIIFGCSTWDLGALQYDFEPFHEELSDYDLATKKVAVFGCGDEAYEDSYCAAIHTIEDTIKKQGGHIIYKNLPINSDFTDEKLEEIKDWGKKIGEQIK